MGDWYFNADWKGLIAIGFIILTIALLIFSISYALSEEFLPGVNNVTLNPYPQGYYDNNGYPKLTEEEDEKEHEEWAKENYPTEDD